MNGGRIELPSGNYTNSELTNKLNTLVTDIDFSFNTNNGKISIENSTGAEVSFVFYDSENSEFTQPKTKYAKTPKFNYNLGWAMGFRPNYLETGLTDCSFNISNSNTVWNKIFICCN